MARIHLSKYPKKGNLCGKKKARYDALYITDVNCPKCLKKWCKRQSSG